MVEKKNKRIKKESSFFCNSHPLLNFVYFTVVIFVTMFSNHPVIIAASFIAAWIYSVILKGKRAMKFNCLVMIPVILITVILNALNVHNGVTVLFFLNNNRITLEAIIFGFIQGIMLGSILIWFGVFNEIITEDKFIYLFGRIAPTIALTISMILRYIPLLKRRFLEISAAQRCMGRSGKGRNIRYRIHKFFKEISILIAWSLESSIESADSMEARGYGLFGRTSFHLFRLSRKELCFLMLMIISGVVCIAACFMDYTNIYYYPAIIFRPFSFIQGVVMALFCVFMYSAVIIEVRGKKL